eukprot:354510-Chlamydomonas_euryale.AAC.7
MTAATQHFPCMPAFEEGAACVLRGRITTWMGWVGMVQGRLDQFAVEALARVMGGRAAAGFGDAPADMATMTPKHCS